MADRSTDTALLDASASPDRVSSLSARLSEALTAVGIAVRRREAEIELIDRTLEASSDAQSAAARQAADRMARLRGEHADELQLMQRARRALEDATAVAGELTLELQSRRDESDEAVREADLLRESLAASEQAREEERARVKALEAEVSARADEAEQSRRALAARETELEQVWRELDVKSREAAELARLMSAFAPDLTPTDDGPPTPPAPAEKTEAEAEAAGEAVPEASDAEEEAASEAGAAKEERQADAGGRAEDADEPPAPPEESELVDAASDDPAASLPRFAEAPDLELSTAQGARVHDVMDELGDVEPLPPLSADEEAGAGDAEGDDAAADPPLDVSVDDWGAVVEGEPDRSADGAGEAAPVADRAAIDGELQAYLQDMGGDEGKGLPPNSLFRAKTDISEFHCANAEEVRLVGALQLQSWRLSELAQLLGLEEGLVRQKLESYHERGLLEVVTA